MLRSAEKVTGVTSLGIQDTGGRKMSCKQESLRPQQRKKKRGTLGKSSVVRSARVAPAAGRDGDQGRNMHRD